MKAISIVVPVYNVENYLAQCIDSILSQTFKNFELILIDDGSKDSSGEICDKYAKIDPRITVIHQSNRGLSAARNVGIDSAKGTYITFIDSDDFILPDMLQMLYDMVAQESVQIACCQHVRCEEKQTIADVVLDFRIEERQVFSEERMKEFLSNKNIQVVAWSKLYRTELFRDVRYPEGKCHEDVFTTYKLIHLAEKIATTNKVGYVYRKNSNSITGKFSVKRLDSIEGKLEQLEFIKQNYSDRLLIRLSSAEVIYACNQCVFQMIKVGYYDKSVEKRLQLLYKKYTQYYVLSTSSIKGKIFACMCYLNIALVRKAINLIGRLKKYF